MLKAVLLLTLVTFPAFAQQTFCTPDFASLPTQTGGRVKPLKVVAQETLRHISGKTKVGKYNSTMAFCLLSSEVLGLKNDISLPLKVDHIKVKEMVAATDSPITAQDGLSFKQELRAAYFAQKENNSFKKELNKVLSRLNYYEQMTAGQLWTIPDISDSQVSWIPMPEYLTEKRAREAGGLAQVFLTAKDNYIKSQGDDYLLELTYVNASPFTWALFMALLSLILTVVIKKPYIGVVATLLTLGVEIGGIALRVLISGRAPITNMYETVMFSGFGALTLAMIIYSYKKEKLFIVGGLSYNVLCLLMMKFANNMLDPSIQNLVPVLRDNFWLSTHVTTVILSYAALALSWMLANIVLVKRTFTKNLTKSDERYYINLIYTCMKYGVVLLSAGVILGGVWADYSWGRFWGWDPKETWSLIVLLIYMAILHGKYTKWVNDKNFVPLVAGAFLSVMMAWFGVNYILATGLHSYGFSEGGAVFLGSFFLLQIGLLIAHKILNLSKSTTV